MTDREALEQLYAFMSGRTYIAGDKESIMDMVQRYKQPPLSMRNQIAMQMTANDYNRLGELMKRIEAHLKETETQHADPEPA